jgi:hypothetical protein
MEYVMDGENKENVYALLNFKRELSTPNDKEGTQSFQPVTFYKLNEDGSFENGTTLEEMLRVSIERLTKLNEKFPCDENNRALGCMQEAILHLEARTKDRKERGVEGQHVA